MQLKIYSSNELTSWLNVCIFKAHISSHRNTQCQIEKRKYTSDTANMNMVQLTCFEENRRCSFSYTLLCKSLSHICIFIQLIQCPKVLHGEIRHFGFPDIRKCSERWANLLFCSFSSNMAALKPFRKRQSETLCTCTKLKGNNPYKVQSHIL